MHIESLVLDFCKEAYLQRAERKVIRARDIEGRGGGRLVSAGEKSMGSNHV